MTGGSSILHPGLQFGLTVLPMHASYLAMPGTEWSVWQEKPDESTQDKNAVRRAAGHPIPRKRQADVCHPSSRGLDLRALWHDHLRLNPKHRDGVRCR